MARKCKREHQAPAPSRKDANSARVRGRWFLFAVLIAVCVLSLLSGSTVAPAFDEQPVIRGEGLIYDKLGDENDESKHLLQVGVSLDGGRVAFDYAVTDPETWNRLAKGDRIGVLYQRSRTGGSIRIREAGLVALPTTNR